nr:non-ribosomal peptide synthetase [Gordonia sp. SID5947]
MPGVFRSAVHRFPERVAVTDLDGAALTYRELDQRSDAVAAGLLAAGVVQGGVVGLATPRTVEVMVAILGILKAGAAYLPLDTSHPAERLSFVVADAAPSLIITDHDGRETLGFLDVERSTIDELTSAGASGTDALPAAVDPRQVAYMIFTSGSTGRPKGVVVEHRSVIALMSAAQRHYGFTEADVWTMFHSYAFDVSVFEMWGPLLFGGRLVVVDFLTTRSPDEFAELLATESVTVVSQTPSAYYQLAAAVRPSSRNRLPASVRYMVFAGEALDFAQVRRWYEDRIEGEGSVGPVLVNMYGITETTVHSTFRALDPDFVASAKGSDVGDGLPALTIHVLDDRLRPVPDGVPGEIYVSGTQVTRGYLGRPGLTSGRFVADPFAGDGKRMYRSGDLAIRREGSLEYLGRSDAQVKLRGFRIELGEVESALLAAEGVDAAAVAVRQRDNGDELLVGYVVLQEAADAAPSEIRIAAAGALPSYMVPDVVMLIDQLPLTVNGKLDRRALPEPEILTVAEYVAPGTETEKILAEIVADVLGLERVSVADSVFDLGGNSLAAARIVGRAGEAFNVDLSVRDVFDVPSVRGLADVVGGRGVALAPVTVVAPRPDRVPLSFAQLRMWFINQFDPAASTYNIPVLLRLAGDLDEDALRAALTDVVIRHEVLRTTFPAPDGVPIQVVDAPESVAERLDWAVVDSGDELQEAISGGFEVTTQWPLRARLWHASADEAVFGLVAHHIAADGESMGPLVADVVAAYSARVSGAEPEFAPLDVQFADYAIWQHEVLGSADDAESVVARQLDYWSTQLAGLPDVLELPADRPRPVVASQRGAEVSFEVPTWVVDRVSVLARERGVTPFMVVHAALAVLLGRLSATDDVAVGTPIAGRGQRVLDPLVGMFVNTLVLRTRARADMSFVELLDQVRVTDLEAFANADVPFETVVEHLQPVRSEAFAPLTQVLLSFDQSVLAEFAQGGVLAEDVAGLEVSSIAVEAVPAKVDLTVGIADGGDRWHGSVIYAVDLFDRGTAEHLAGQLVRLLDQLTLDPARPIGDTPLLADEDAAALLPVTGGPSAAPQLLAEVFGEVARAHPHQVAVSDGRGTELSYAELDSRSNQLARWLIRQGVGTESLVALAIGRSTDLLTAMWAVAKTGAGYLPIDPDYPAERIEHMLTDSQVRIGLTTERRRATLPSEVRWSPVETIGSDDVAGALDDSPIRADELTTVPRLDAVAYVIYTSGSTGTPKGVSVTYRGIHNFAVAEVARFGVDTSSRVLGFASPSFDASILEWLLASTSGATFVYRPDSVLGGDMLAELIRDRQLTHVFLTPTVLATLEPESVPDLRVLMSGGEAVSQTLVDRWSSELSFFNAYGPTEASIAVAMSHALTPGSPVHIGGPIDGVGLLVLDSRLHPVPIGVPGDLYAAGVALARGYLRRPSLTSERFVANPFAGRGERMYRTGDVVRWRRAGTGGLVLEYVGRSDDQVKLRGLRIELGEIEAALESHPAVSSAVVIGVGGSVASALAAYVVAGRSVDAAVLRDHVAERLPAHMVPSSIATLDALPLTPAGKLDKRALPAPVIDTGAADYVPPSSSAEETLAAVVAGVLGVDRVSVVESFFALGGDSILSIQLSSAARAAGLSLSPREVFEHKTVRAMARAVAAGGDRLPLVDEPEGDTTGEVELSPVVSWMLELSDTPEDFADFSQSVVMVAPDALDTTVLSAVLGTVADAHPMLSSRLVFTGGRWCQTAGVGHPPVVDGVSTPAAIGTPEFAEAVRSAHAAALARMDPSNGVLVSAVLVTGTDGARVVLAIHHLCVDAVSWPVLIEDVITVWGQLVTGDELAVRPEVTSARAWHAALADRCADRSGEVDHWLSRSGTPTDLGSSIDPVRDRFSTVGSVPHRIDAAVTEALVTVVPEAFSGHVNDALLAGLARAVRSWQLARGIADSAPVGVLVEGHGRYEEVLAKGADPRTADLSRTVGWFTTIAPMLVDPSDDVVHAVKAAKEERLAQPDHGVGFGLLRFGGDERLAGRPLPSIGFNFFGAGGRGADAEPVEVPFLVDVDAPALPSSVAGAMTAMNVVTVNVGTRVTARGRELSADFLFAGGILTADDVRDLADRWSAELAAIVEVVARGEDLGLSPSDIPGSGVTQADLDMLAERYPGAPVWPLTALQEGLYLQSALTSGRAPPRTPSTCMSARRCCGSAARSTSSDCVRRWMGWSHTIVCCGPALSRRRAVRLSP